MKGVGNGTGAKCKTVKNEGTKETKKSGEKNQEILRYSGVREWVYLCVWMGVRVCA